MKELVGAQVITPVQRTRFRPSLDWRPVRILAYTFSTGWKIIGGLYATQLNARPCHFHVRPGPGEPNLLRKATVGVLRALATERQDT